MASVGSHFTVLSESVRLAKRTASWFGITNNATLSLLGFQFVSTLEKHRVCSCVIYGVGGWDGGRDGGGSGAGVSSLDLDLLEHGLHRDEEAGLVNAGV